MGSPAVILKKFNFAIIFIFYFKFNFKNGEILQLKFKFFLFNLATVDIFSANLKASTDHDRNIYTGCKSYHMILLPLKHLDINCLLDVTFKI